MKLSIVLISLAVGVLASPKRDISYNYESEEVTLAPLGTRPGLIQCAFRAKKFFEECAQKKSIFSCVLEKGIFFAKCLSGSEDPTTESPKTTTQIKTTTQVKTTTEIKTEGTTTKQAKETTTE